MHVYIICVHTISWADLGPTERGAKGGLEAHMCLCAIYTYIHIYTHVPWVSLLKLSERWACCFQIID